MATTTTITLQDEGTRRALTFAVWERAHSEFADGTSAFYDESRGAVDWAEWTAELPMCEQDVEVLRVTLRDSDRIRTAVCGETIELETPPAALSRGVGGCVDYVREHEQFWDAAPDERVRQLETFDAARRLAKSIEPAELVA